VLLAGKGIFRPEDVPVKEEGVSRVAFGMLKKLGRSLEGFHENSCRLPSWRNFIKFASKESVNFWCEELCIAHRKLDPKFGSFRCFLKITSGAKREAFFFCTSFQ